MRILTTYKALPGQSLYATVGMFDGVHSGHRYLIERLKQIAQKNKCRPLVITFASHPRKTVNPNSKPELLTTASQKLRLIEDCGVPYCLLLEFSREMLSMSTEQFLVKLKTEMGVAGIVAGFNNRFGNEKEMTSTQQRDIALSLGMDYHVVDEFSEGGGKIHISSSQIRALIQNQRIDEANRLLGHRFEISGTVGGGMRIGRTIGFPTANLMPDDTDVIVPADGVYACVAALPGRPRSMYPAMVNIGRRPTIGEGLERTIEAHVIGFNDNKVEFYGESMRLIFLDFIRDEVKFGVLQELKTRLETDRKITLEKYMEFTR